jgi:D-3-phosphoglycerate dehydrogenase
MLGMFERFRADFQRRSIEPVAAVVTQTLSEDELIDALPDFDGWIIGDDPATARVLEAGAAGRLRALVKWGVGVDNVDFATAERLGMPATNTPGVFGREVADLAVNYVGGLARHSFRIDREIREGNAWPKYPGCSLGGKTAALVGFGDIGRNIAKRLLAAEMKLRVYDPFYSPVEGVDAEVLEWPQGLDGADFVVFSAPLNPSTHHLLNRSVLSHLKDGVRIVNVGRGPVIEEQALVEGLKSGKIHSVALDVFESEPLALDNPLRAWPNNIFGSHNGSNTIEAVERVSRAAIELIADMLAK